MRIHKHPIIRSLQALALLLSLLNSANAEQLIPKQKSTTQQQAGEAYLKNHFESRPKGQEIESTNAIRENWGITLAGAATTIAIHELGHFMVAGLEDVDASFDGVTVTYRNTENTDRQNLRLSSAGYQFQWLASEYAFSQLDRPQLSARAQAWNSGMVLGHIGITIAYLSFLKDHEDGDAVGSSVAAGMSTDQLIGLLAIPAVLDSWRLFGKHSPHWASWASRGFKSIGISAIWTF